MSRIDAFKQITQKLSGVRDIDSDKIRQLQKILEVELAEPVSYEEAKSVGEKLITIYKVLAGDREILGIAPNKGGDHEH